MNPPSPADATRPPRQVPPTDRAATVQLQRRAVRGSVMSLANQIIKLATHLVTMYLVTLYLDRAELGLFGLAFSVQTLTMLIRDCGLANALIQKKDLNETHLNSVLWFTVVSSVALAGVLLLLARPLAGFYAQAELVPMLGLVTVPLIVQGFGTIQETQLRKHLRFARLLVVDSGSTLVASLVTIVAVVLGAGVWGLMLRIVLGPVLSTIGYWMLSSWRPRWEFSPAALQTLWSFGGYFFLTALAGYGLTRLDVPIINKLIGEEAGGTFFMARALALAPLQELAVAVGRVMFPVFSALQDDPATLRSGYLTGTRCFAVLLFPLIAGMVSVSPEAVALILPLPWHSTVPLIQIIALHGVLQCNNTPASQILYARGRSRLQFAYSSVIGLFVVAAFVLGARWGVTGVALAWTVVAFTAGPLVLGFAAREIDLPIVQVLSHLAAPAAAAVGAALAVRALCVLWSTAGRPVGFALLMLEVVVGLGAYAALCRWLLPNTLRKLRNDLSAAGFLRFVGP